MTFASITVIQLPWPTWLGAIYGVSEIALLLGRRSNSRGGQSKDRHSLALLWLVIFISIYASLAVPIHFPTATIPHHRFFSLIGITLFAVGVILRWWAIVVLGKFFTVDVAIAEQHRLIQSGPYQFVRHPSYTGALIAFLGFGLCVGNWISILCLMVPITAAFLWRIRIEERALLGALGDVYRSYMQRTKRLIPFVL